MHPTNRWSCLFLVCFTALAGAACDGKRAEPEAEWKFENPLREVAADEWARYRLSDENSWTVEVVDPGGRDGPVTVREQTRGSDVNEILASPVKRLHRNHLLNGYESAGWTIQRMYEDTVEVADRRWKSMCIEYLTHGHGVVRVWYSHEVPVFGMLKQVVIKPSGQETVNAELESWSGRSEE
jgi:hypothetical protein